jgi:hypothetical protein
MRRKLTLSIRPVLPGHADAGSLCLACGRLTTARSGRASNKQACCHRWSVRAADAERYASTSIGGPMRKVPLLVIALTNLVRRRVL